MKRKTVIKQSRPNRTIQPYTSIHIRVPSSLKPQIDQLKDEFYRHMSEGGDPLNPPNLLSIHVSNTSVNTSNLIDVFTERYHQLMSDYAEINEKYLTGLDKSSSQHDVSKVLTQISKLTNQLYFLLRDIGQYIEGDESGPVSSDPPPEGQSHG